jgi:hypothetical protein
MKISEKIANMMENGWQLHEYYSTELANDGTEVKIPIGLQPGQFCREVDGIFLVYGGEPSPEL